MLLLLLLLLLLFRLNSPPIDAFGDDFLPPASTSLADPRDETPSRARTMVPSCRCVVRPSQTTGDGMDSDSRAGRVNNGGLALVELSSSSEPACFKANV